MRKILVIATLLAISAVVAPAPALATTTDAVARTVAGSRPPTCTPSAAIKRMTAYIRSQQLPDGSFPGIGQSSTADAVFALIASGVDPSRVKTNGHSAIDWIYAQSDSLDSTGTAAKFLLALTLSHRSTVTPDGFDYVSRVSGAYDPTTGLYDANPTGNHYAVVALRAAHRPVPGRALTAVAAQQQSDGGWSGYTPPEGTDTNTTAIAVIALTTGGRLSPIPGALGFLRTQQSPEGGFTFSTEYGNASDANSTGLTILTLLATNQNLRNWEKAGVDPLERLLQLQNPSGAFRYSDAFPADNAFATFQAGQAAGLTRCHH
jgi:hypothetical protein